MMSEKNTIWDRLKFLTRTGYKLDPHVYQDEVCIRYKDIYIEVGKSLDNDDYCVTWSRDTSFPLRDVINVSKGGSHED